LEAISREVSLYNLPLPPFAHEAISREISIYNLPLAALTFESISREVSVYNLQQPVTSFEAISREVSVYNLPQPGIAFEAISREVSVYNLSQAATAFEAISREVSMFVATNLVPDLVVAIVDSPTAAVAGSTVELVFIITNQGPVPAVGPWTDQFLLSEDASGVFAQSIVSANFTNSLPAGGSITLTQTVMLPVNSFGTRFIGVRVDSTGQIFEGREGNNTDFRAISILYPPLPDLAVTEIFATNRAVGGQVMQLSWVVTNAGNVTARAPWSETVLLADNPNGSNATVLDAVSVTNSLPAGAIVTRTRNLIVPSGLSGSYWLVLQTDTDNQVFEGFGETNNLFIAPQPLAITSCDLEVIQLASDSAAVFGESIEVTWVVRNRGTAPTAVSWIDRLVLSSSNSSPAGSTALLSSPSTNLLAPGESYTNSVLVTLPLNKSFQPGTYFLVLQTDAGGVLPEISKSNNLMSRTLSLSFPPLPDLTVSGVISPTAASPGDVILAVWSVTNQSSAIVSGIWAETVRLVAGTNANSAFLPFAPTLVTLTFSNTLATGASLLRTQYVAVPLNGPSGETRLAVTVDARDDVLEDNETNNTTFATEVLRVPVALSLQLSSAQISEDATVPIRATLSRNGDTAQALTVAVTNGNPAELSFVPGLATPPVTNITIPAGQAAVTFNLYALHDHMVDGDKPVTISARALGYESASVQVTVVNVDLPTLTLTAATNAVIEGLQIGVTITRDVVTSNALTVALSSSSPGQLSPPSFVTIPAGAASTNFFVLGVDDANAEPTNTYSISASAAGFNSGLANITLLDNDVPQLTVSLSTHAVSEGAGAQAVSMTVTRSPIGAGALNIEPEAGDPALVVTPLRITIPGGQASRSFPIGVIDDTVVNGTRQVVLTAYALAAGRGARLSSAAPDVLTVMDDDGPTLKLAAAQKLVREGSNPATTVTVTRNTSATNDLLVTLTTSRTNEATFVVSALAGPPPEGGTASLTIPTGQTSATFTLATVNDHTNDGNQTVILTADGPGFTEGLETIVVSDTDLPDLVVSSVSGPASAVPQERVVVTYHVANQGLSATSGHFLTRIYFSGDAVVGGDDVLVAQFRNTNSIPVGSFIEDIERIQLPLAVGNYWVVVETDAEQTLAEVLEDNNTRISAAPIAVAADYAAWVQTEVTNAPANTPVPLYGRATNSLGAGVASRPVNIHVLVRGTQRILSATTDASGNFATTFTPLPGEAGRYEIFATHPGVSSVPVQDTFSLLGFRANPSSVSLTIIEGTTRSGSVSLENLSDVPLNGLSVQVVSKPGNLQVTTSVGNPQLSTQTSLNYSFTATTADAYGTVQLRVTTAEGVSQDIYFGLSVEPIRPRLVAIPNSLYSAMPVGGQAVVEFDVANLGGRGSGPITVSLPAVPWMHLASTNPMPSLAPGQTNRMTLQLTPARDLPLGPYIGNLALNADGSGTSIPFNFRAMSVCVGDLLVDAVDEFTYYAEGAPHLGGATVTVRDAVTRANVITGTNNVNGHFFVSGLQENYYEIEVTADHHTTYRATHLLRAGITNQVEAFLSRQTVTYTWTVEPIQLEDRYRITIETVFETVVPVPVVTVEPSVIDLSDVNGEESTINLKITNQGLISANTARLQFPTHPSWEIKPLVEDLGNIPARTSYTVPVTIRRIGSGAGGARQIVAAAAQPSGACSYAGTVCWTLPCGVRTNSYCSTVGVVNASQGCGGGGGGGFYPVVGGGGPGNGSPTSPYVVVVAVSPPSICDCSLIPKFCLGGEIGFDLNSILEQMVSKLLSKLPGIRAEEAKLTFNGSGQICLCCTNNQLSWEAEGEAKASVSITLAGGPGLSGSVDWEAPGWGEVSISGDALLGVRGKLSGEISATLTRPCGGEPELCFGGEVGLEVFAGGDFNGEATATLLSDHASYHGEVHGKAGLEGSLSISVHGCVGEDPVFEFCGSVSSRLNASGELSATVAGIERKASFSANADVPLWDSGCESGNGGALRRAIAAARGLPIREPINTKDILRSDAQILAALGVTPRGAGICARVKLRLEQEAAITRDAFRATLELDNNGPSRLENVRVAVDIWDESGRTVTNLFAQRFEGATVLSAVDGTGILAGNSTGTAKWLLIPTVDAAPQVATRFLVGGTLSYRLDGNDVTVDMTPVPITVLPSPRLTLQYFHQRDVFSDDPFTDIIEPSIPYSLAVMVQNRGYGVAKNFRIISAQPKIIENEKGLLIDFNIIATEVFKAGTNFGLTPSLTANFGDINAGDTAIGRWLLTSTLQGLFIDYSARFEHIDGLGNLRLSLIDDVSIHEMNHLVQASGIWEDGKPDFLVNEVPDIHDYPDTLYQSNGSTNPVAGQFAGHAHRAHAGRLGLSACA
jgi:subtilase family serine protease